MTEIEKPSPWRVTWHLVLSAVFAYAAYLFFSLHDYVYAWISVLAVFVWPALLAVEFWLYRADQRGRREHAEAYAQIEREVQDR